MKYYFIQSIITYDGYDFISSNVIQRKRLMTMKQAEKEVKNYHGHEDSYEILELNQFKEITEEEFNVLNKFL